MNGKAKNGSSEVKSGHSETVKVIEVMKPYNTLYPYYLKVSKCLSIA